MEMNLQYFAGSLMVTVYKDAGMTTASASPSSSLAKDDKVTLTLTPASGYEVADVEVISGGVTITEGETISFLMGEADVILNVKSHSTSKYKVVENCYCAVNGTVTKLQRNMEIVYGVNGAIVGVKGTESTISLNADLIANLLASGVIVKDPAWHGEPEPDDT